jgi:hypothetical protein
MQTSTKARQDKAQKFPKTNSYEKEQTRVLHHLEKMKNKPIEKAVKSFLIIHLAVERLCLESTFS